MLKQVGPLLIAMTWLGTAHAASLRACIPDYPSAPFSSPNGEAAGQHLVALAVQRQGDAVQFTAAPWARSLAGMRSGDYDLLIGAEPDDDVFAYIAFPQKAGKVDPSRRLGVVEYVLVQKVDAHPAWEGRAFKGASRPVVVPRDIYAVSRHFDVIGVALRSLNYDAGRFAALLCRDRAEFIVLRRSDLAAALSGCPTMPRAQLQAYPLAAADVYLGVRKALLQSRPELGESIWRELARLRSSGAWPVLFKDLPPGPVDEESSASAPHH